MTPDHISEVSGLMNRYFEGLYQADSTLLRRVFHPKLSYICATEGDELYLDLDTYMSRIDQREPPAKRGEAREDVLFEMSFAGERLAHVKARMTLMARDYVDYLTLVRHENEWRIVTKVFSYLPKGG